MKNYFELKTPALKIATELASNFELKDQGINYTYREYWNLTEEALYEEIIFRGEGAISKHGAILVETGKHTARAASDKFVVEESSTKNEIWWGNNNRPIAEEKYNVMYERLLARLQGEDLFIQDCYVGADPNYQMPIRIITEIAWHSLFARNMFITTSDKDKLKNFKPEFTVICVPGFKVEPNIDGSKSETAIVLNFSKKTAIIANTLYGGEIKKSIFTVLNFLLTFKDVLPMHCSANVGMKGDTALFFGLSGTGKTTLSADPKRKLIGDDEHGWSKDGIFNFEGGCYAKVIRLSEESEPQIFATTKKFSTILENVVMDPLSREIDLDDDSLTENTRASYPIESIENIIECGYKNTHPKNVIFLTCDASGVLPPIAKLTPEQAQYHFISGYTSKIAGTEIGIGKEPQIAFSACFGAPFMVRHPFEYAKMLKQRLVEHNSNVWLVNTGWIGGKFGIGKRISIKHTRNLLNAALEGLLDNVEYRKDRLFGYSVPTSCPNVPSELLDPSNSWIDKNEYWEKYDLLASKFIANFKQFESEIDNSVIEGGPKRLANI